jgi:hypothetical protein
MVLIKLNQFWHKSKRYILLVLFVILFIIFQPIKTYDHYYNFTSGLFDGILLFASIIFGNAIFSGTSNKVNFNKLETNTYFFAYVLFIVYYLSYTIIISNINFEQYKIAANMLTTLYLICAGVLLLMPAFKFLESNKKGKVNIS